MPKAKLSQIANTWVDENIPKTKGIKQKSSQRKVKEQPKKKQTFNLKIDTIKRLWLQRIRTDKTLSIIIDEMVAKNLPKYRK